MADVCLDKDAHGCTLLMTAVQSGTVEVVRDVSGLMARYLTIDQASCIILYQNVLSRRAFTDACYRDAKISHIVALPERTLAQVMSLDQARVDWQRQRL